MNKHDGWDYLNQKNRCTDYICSAIYTAGANSASNSHSANNNAKHRKRERDRARYATMSQEEKNAICLRQREVRQKKKGDRCVTYLWCYKYITCNLDGLRSQGSYKLVGLLNTSTSFVTFSHIFLLWYRSMYGCHNISTR